MVNHRELIEALTTEFVDGAPLLSTRQQIAQILQDAHQRLAPEPFSELLPLATKAFSMHCGCAEELEELESVLDELFDAGVIDEGIYQHIIESTACSRWL